MAEGSAPISRDEIHRLVVETELRIERRVAALEADVREMQARVVVRDGPIVDEIHKLENAQIELRGMLHEAQKVLDEAVTPDTVEKIARGVVRDESFGQRGLTDFSMRVVMFGVSLGTLIFVVKA